MTDTPLTAPDVNLLANIGYKYALETMTTEQLRARVAVLTAALGEAVSWMEATNDYESLSPVGHALTRDAIQKARAAMEETR